MMTESIKQRCCEDKEDKLTAVGQRRKKTILKDNRQTLQNPLQRNNTGLPDNLKSGMENLSGINLDNVRVHYNSDKPAAVQAHAYAQGNEIHLASGQEKHLPHELGHVVQQAQGKVQPNATVAGMNVNDSLALENEATRMGEMALQRAAMKSEPSVGQSNVSTANASSKTIQGRWTYNRDLADFSGEVIYYDPDTMMLYDPETRELKEMGDDTGTILTEPEAQKLMKRINQDVRREDDEELLRLGFSPEDIEELDGLYDDNSADLEEEVELIALEALRSPRKVNLMRELGSETAIDLTSSITLGDQIDTSSLDSASGEKTAYNIADSEEEALIIKRNVMPSSVSLAQEVETLRILKDKYDLPVSEVHNMGVINIKDVYFPALVMKNYDGSSKMIGHNTGSKYVQSEAAPRIVPMLNAKKAVQSLQYIASILQGKKIAIPDLQFLVDDSNFFINDPNGFVTAKDRKTYTQVNAQNMELLGGLIRTIKIYAAPETTEEADGKYAESDESGSDDEGPDLEFWESEVARAEKANAPKLTRRILKGIQEVEQTPQIQLLVKRLALLKQ